MKWLNLHWRHKDTDTVTSTVKVPVGEAVSLPDHVAPDYEVLAEEATPDDTAARDIEAFQAAMAHQAAAGGDAAPGAPVTPPEAPTATTGPPAGPVT